MNIHLIAIVQPVAVCITVQWIRSENRFFIDRQPISVWIIAHPKTNIFDVDYRVCSSTTE